MAGHNADDTVLEQQAQGRWRVKIGYVLGNFARRLKRPFPLGRDLIGRDPMAGVLSPESFEAAMAQQLAVALASHSTLLLALIDLDSFEGLSQRLGREKADRVLHDFARQARRLLGRNDLLARITDVRFAMLVAVESTNDGERFAVGLHAGLTMIHSREVETMTCGMGALLVTPLGRKSPSTLMSHVERLLSIAKRDGQNAVEIARSESDVFRRVHRYAALGEMEAS